MSEEDKDSKTEEPTPNQIKKFRERGQVAFSKEVTAAAGLIAGGLTMAIVAMWSVEQIDGLWRVIGEEIKSGRPQIDRQFFGVAAMTFARVLTPPALVMTAVAVFVGAVQTKGNFSWKSIEPKLERLDPIKKLKKMIFSTKPIVEMLRSVLKVSLLSAVASWALLRQAEVLVRMPHQSLNQSVAVAGEVFISLGFALGVAVVVLAIIDYAWQRHQLNEEMRMSKKEIKDEFKEQEGDPLLKGARRARQRQMAAERGSVQAAADATVVIVNPTHIAVALRYDPALDTAPRVLCKGREQVAAEIRKIARAGGVPVIQRRALARLMFKTCKVGHEVPVDLYEAVAEILALVMKLKRRGRRADV